MLRAALWGFDKHPPPSLSEFDMKFFYLFPRKQNDLETQMTGKWNCRGYSGSVKLIPFYSNDGMWIWKSTFSNLSGVLFLKTHRKQNSSSLQTITIWESCKNQFGDQLPVSSKHHN